MKKIFLTLILSFILSVNANATDSKFNKFIKWLENNNHTQYLEINKNYQQNNLSQLTDLDLNYLNDNKKQFVKTVLPIIINENQKILISRNFINDLKTKLNTFKTLNNNEIKKPKYQRNQP